MKLNEMSLRRLILEYGRARAFRSFDMAWGAALEDKKLENRAEWEKQKAAILYREIEKRLEGM